MAKKAKSKLKPPRAGWEENRRTAFKWIQRARFHLRQEVKAFRELGRHEAAQDSGIACLILGDVFEHGEPGLLLGMYYTPDWRLWRDVTEQPPEAAIEREME